MEPHKRSLPRTISEWMLRIAIIAFLFAFMFAMDFGPDAETQFLQGFLGILKIIVFAAISILLIVFRKSYFKYTAFFVVLFASLFRFLVLIGMEEFQWESFTYILTFCLAFYGLVRSVPKERKPFRKKSLK